MDRTDRVDNLNKTGGRFLFAACGGWLQRLDDCQCRADGAGLRLLLPDSRSRAVGGLNTGVVHPWAAPGGSNQVVCGLLVGVWMASVGGSLGCLGDLACSAVRAACSCGLFGWSAVWAGVFCSAAFGCLQMPTHDSDSSLIEF